ncbi:hypothetical protein ACGE24_04285 [Corynebacterium kroppenstedtii]|uniref:hypothetical protein n=1 Tax=Corynebacterium sp. PCR 32 TaxID=3351342 RepID=UPI0030A250F5
MGKRTNDHSAIDPAMRRLSLFRDKEAEYEARYYARVEARKNGALGHEVSTSLGRSALHEEVEKCLYKGPKERCCQSSPRCIRCPYVVAHLRRMDITTLDDDALGIMIKKLRKRHHTPR